MDIRFNHLEALHWLWAVLALLVVVVAGFRLRRRALERFATPALLDRIISGAAPARRVIRAVLVVAALVLLIASLIDPRWGVTFRQVRQRGIDLVVVLDVSRSMLAEDARPNRLDRAKAYIRDLADQLGGDRIALVSFAGAPSLQCPLTVDRGAFRLALDVVEAGSAPRGGSLIGDALRVAATAFTDEVPDHKAIIVFSDGEDHGSYPVEAATRLGAERSIPVFTVGIGDSAEGGRIPVEVDGARTYLEYRGEQVWSKMNPEILRDIALASGGAYIPVGTGTVDMGQVYAERIAPLAKREFETATKKVREPRYQWFAVAALVLLLVEAGMRDVRSPRPSSGPGRMEEVTA